MRKTSQPETPLTTASRDPTVRANERTEAERLASDVLS